MEDIILEDPRKTSAKAVAAKQKKVNKKRRFREYLVDLIVKSLICTVLAGLNFTLYAEAGSYSLFTNEQTLAPEAVFIYAAIAACSFLIIFILSFSLFLQNLISAIIGTLFILAVLNQFALFDQHSILSAMFGQYFGSDINSVLGNSSHLIIAGITGFIFLLFLTYGRRSDQAYFLGTLTFIFAYVLSDAYFDPSSPYFKNIPANENDFTHPDGRNFVFLTFPDMTSYNNLKSWADAPQSSDAEKTAAANALGFYAQNHFTHYPSAYVNSADKPFINLVETFNPSFQTKADEKLLSDVMLNSYWDFSNLSEDKLYLKDNKIFENFRNNSYNINVYQSRGLEMCRVNNIMRAGKCIAKTTPPINLNNGQFNLVQKTILLASEWLESTGLTNGLTPLLKIASYLGIDKDIKPLNFSTANLYVHNAPRIFERITKDIKTGKGNNAYFAVIDLPSDLYMYDSFCTLKPVSEWMGLDNQSNNVLVKRRAYAEQLNCLYGQLENFVQELKKSSKLDKTVIVIQGLNNPLPLTAAPNQDYYQEIKNQKQTALAIFDPAQNKSFTDSRICSAPDILSGYLLNKKDCRELENLKISNQLRDDILEKNKQQQISEQEIANAQKRYQNWYQAWAGHNQIENMMLEAAIPLEKTEPTIEEKIIKDAPVAEKVEELPKETEVKELSAVTETKEKEPETPASEENKETLPQPDEIKKEAEAAVKVETKVIENETSHDVVPPFLLGETKYRPAEENQE